RTDRQPRLADGAPGDGTAREHQRAEHDHHHGHARSGAGPPRASQRARDGRPGDGLHGVRAGGEVARTPCIRRQVKETAMFSYYIKLAALSIRRNLVLSALMMLAIAVGIGAFMTMLTVHHMMSNNP